MIDNIGKAPFISALQLRWNHLSPEKDKFLLMAKAIIDTFGYYEEFLRRGPRLKGKDDFEYKKWVRDEDDYPFLKVEDIKKVVAPILKKEADIVLGSRFLGRAVNLPLLKKIVLKMGIIVVFILYGIKISDSQSGFRAMTRKAALKIKITADKMEHAGEIMHEIIRNKLKYKEIPITVIYDEYSLNKGQSWSKSLDLGFKMLLRRLIR